MPTRSILFLLLAGLYAAGAGLAAWNVISGAQASTHSIEQTLLKYSLKNEGTQALEKYQKKHPFIGAIISSPVRHSMDLPSDAQSNEALYDDVPSLLQTVRKESSVTAWWSWALLSLSLFYVVAIIAGERRLTTRPVLFALTLISVTFFLIGIIAPAMVIWTAPTIPMETGPVSFVLQHEVRGIAAIIWELMTSGHFIIGGFLFLFSIVTPLTKASLTFFVCASGSKKRNHWIGELLHAIGKWSMADVFVAAILLALYALKFQQATRSIPCLGLYYFIGYCLLSMTTTELLVNSDITGAPRAGAREKIDLGFILGLCAAALCFAAATSLYTYQQYSENLHQKIPDTNLPTKLNNADLVLPAHK